MALENIEEIIEVKVNKEPPKSRLYQLRCRKFLKPYQIAKKLQISTKKYNVYESNPERIPAHILIELSNIFKVSIDYILNNSDAPTLHKNIKKRIESTLNGLKDREKNNVDRIKRKLLSTSPKDIENAYEDINNLIEAKYNNEYDLIQELFNPLPYIESELETTTKWKFKIVERIYKRNSSIEKIAEALDFNEDTLMLFFNTKQIEEEIRTSMLIPLFRELGISFNLITGEGLCFNELLFRRIAIKGKHLSNQNKVLFLKYLKYIQGKKYSQAPTEKDILIPNTEEKLSDRIAYLRKVVGYNGNKVTQQELAELIKEHCTGKYKCSLRTVTKIENENLEDDINIKYIYIIASLWNISIDYLLGDTYRNIHQADFLQFYKKFSALSKDKQILVENYLKNT